MQQKSGVGNNDLNKDAEQKYISVEYIHGSFPQQNTTHERIALLTGLLTRLSGVMEQ